MTALGTLAAILAALGIYGVLASGVRQRWQEIGIRMALGATPETVVNGIVHRGVGLAAFGLIIGGALAWALSGTVASLVHEISPTEPLVLGAAAASMLLIVVVASWLPARQASRVDPAETLQAD